MVKLLILLMQRYCRREVKKHHYINGVILWLSSDMHQTLFQNNYGFVGDGPRLVGFVGQKSYIPPMALPADPALNAIAIINT